MINEYDEIAFIKSVINEYILYADDDYKSEIIFQKHYNKLLETVNINIIFHKYFNDFDIDIDDIKNYYNSDYIKIKIGIILHMKVITYIIDDYFNDYDYYYV